MDARYEIVSPKQAKEFSEFLLPYILDDEEFNSFWFYVAIKDERVVGMLCESGTKAMPEILSIGVSPKYKGQGIGKGLLAFAIKEMTDRIPEEEFEIPNAISARLVTPVGRMDDLKRLFEGAGFVADSESKYYKVPIAMLDFNPVVQNEKSIKKVEKLRAEKTILSLREASPAMIKAFGKRMMDEGMIAKLDTGVLDEKLTFFATDGNEIAGGVLFKKEENRLIQNLLLYVDEEKLPMSMPGYLLTAAASEAINAYPTSMELMFWIGEEETKKLINTVFPDAKPDTEVCEMERAF